MIEITTDIIEAVAKDFEKIDSAYRFDYELFKISSMENKLTPPVTPILWSTLIGEKRILSVEELVEKVKSHPDFFCGKIENVDADKCLYARCRQFWTGFLRELDFVIKLKKEDRIGKVYKDIYKDLGLGGIDIVYINKWDTRFDFSIKMKGGRVCESREKRKKSKTDCSVTPVFIKAADRYSLAKVESDIVRGYVEYRKCN